MDVALRGGSKKFETALDFFFFLNSGHQNYLKTNKCAGSHILEKPTHSPSDGSWKVTPSEMLKFTGPVIYMGIVKVSRLKLYWNVGNLYSGLLPPRIMLCRCFIALLAMLHVADLDNVSLQSREKLRNMVDLLQKPPYVLTKLFQPHHDLSMDERMVKSKGQSGIRQYIKDKGTKWGYKL